MVSGNQRRYLNALSRRSRHVYIRAVLIVVVYFALIGQCGCCTHEQVIQEGKEGRVRYEGQYEICEGERRLHGDFKAFYSDGSIVAGEYSHGRKDREWIRENAEGVVVSRIMYDNDIPDGVFEIFYDDGTKSEHGHFDQGRPKGFWTEYHSDGKEKARGKYVIKGDSTDIWLQEFGTSEWAPHNFIAKVGTWDYWSEDGQHSTVVHSD